MARKVIFDKKNIIITGGAGFIGSHLCDELIKDSKVICIDNFIENDEINIDHLLVEPDFIFIKHDITKPINLEEFPELERFKIEFQGIQEIYNLACPMSPVNFEQNTIEIIKANSVGMINVMELALKYSSKLLHFSSSVIYGNQPMDEKVKEDNNGNVDPISKRSSYDEGKRFAEAVVCNYRDKYHLDFKIIRPFRIYGPRMKLNDGQMIPDFINNALDNKDLVIYGNKDFSSAFCYISDLVDASLKLMDSNLAGPVNIGSDVRMNLTEVAEKIIKFTDSKSKISYSDNMLFLTPLCLPDITKARKELDWMPIVTFNKGIEKTIYELKAAKGLINIGR